MKKIVVCILFFCVARGYAELIRIENFSDAESKISQLALEKKDVIAFVDIHMTLIQADHPALYIPNIKKNLNSFKRVVSELSEEEKKIFFSYALKREPQKAVENTIYTSLQNLKKQKVKLVACTASQVGPLGSIPSVEKWFFDSLSILGMDFSSTFSYLPTTFSVEDGVNPSAYLYYKGILLTKGASKGKAILALLKKTATKPTLICCIDNNKDHLQEMEKLFAEYDPKISFVGFLYTRAFVNGSKSIAEDQFEQYWTEKAIEIKALR